LRRRRSGDDDDQKLEEMFFSRNHSIRNSQAHQEDRNNRWQDQSNRQRERMGRGGGMRRGRGADLQRMRKRTDLICGKLFTFCLRSLVEEVSTEEGSTPSSLITSVKILSRLLSSTSEFLSIDSAEEFKLSEEEVRWRGSCCCC
jgi:hypothetical protein